MAASTRVKDLLWRVSDLLGDVRPQFNRWPERSLVNWLNDGQLVIARFLPPSCSGVYTVRLQPGTRQSIESIAPADIRNVDGSTPSTTVFGVQLLSLVRNMGTAGTTPGRAIADPIDRRVLDTSSPNWHLRSSQVIDQYVYDPQVPLIFYVDPGVPSGRLWVEASMIVRPTLVPNTGTDLSPLYSFDGTSTTLISISDEYVPDLVDYICARAFGVNQDYAGDPNKEAGFANRFLGSLNSKVAALTGANPNLQRLPMAPQPLGQAS